MPIPLGILKSRTLWYPEDVADVREAALNALRSVEDPDFHQDIVALGFVKNLEVEGGIASATIELTTPACPAREQIRMDCEQALLGVEGVDEVRIEMTARVRDRAAAQEDLIPGVKNCLAIASGKGGVGKSTVTVNLAIALAKSGAKVGLMDADVYGPSIPMMLGIENERPFTENSKILPLEAFGVKVMSLGVLLEEGQAVMWRGPMVAATVRQLLADVNWGDLDYLLVDLPPGTGDAPMSLAQLVPLTGVVIVTTPHHVAANIAGKAAQLFRRLKAPIVGVVENMAGFVCPTCGTLTDLFAGLPGKELAKEIGARYLGSIPLDPVVSEASANGEPSILAYPHRPQAKAFYDIAGELARQVSIANFARETADMA